MGRYESARVKYYDTSRDHILNSVESSLKLMGIDYIDLLLLHRPDPLINHFETGAALDEVIASGKVRNVGVSNFKPWDWKLLQTGMNEMKLANPMTPCSWHEIISMDVFLLFFSFGSFDCFKAKVKVKLS